MRTTVTIEPDVALLLREEMERSKVPFKQVLNNAIRQGLSRTNSSERPRFQVRPHSFGFKPGIDQNRLNQLVDELEIEELAKKLAEGR